MKKYPDFWHILIGNSSPGTFWGLVVIAYICAGVIVLVEASNRDISSSATPIKFSWRFLLADNLLRFITSILLIPIAVRATYERVGGEWALFMAMGVGFGVDSLALLAKNMGLLTTKWLSNKMVAKLSATDLTVIEKPAIDVKN
jgi:hypothetical protein